VKKLLIAGVAALGLVLSGCTESKTGLQKNVINTGFEKCTDYLTSSLKSPSSLRIGEAAVFVQKPEAQDVYSVFGDIVVKDGKITEIARDNKRRFREMLVSINYEAQNSYGVYLGGTYQCQYLFELNNDEISPEPLNTYLIKLKSDGEDVGLGVHIPIADFTGSNWVLDKQIKKLISTTDSKFAAADEEMYKELIKQKEYADQELEAEKIRKSWESLSAEEAAEQAAAVAIDAAEAALRE
jgi:major membrane immunogen (membrane-anchored lipoprotein)